jgi:fluoride exporter
VTALLVMLGAVVGAPLRYLTDRAVQARHDSVFPWGTFTVNVAGCSVLGFIAAAARLHGVDPDTVNLAGTGFCGALTTYSTFGYETVRLFNTRRPAALANVIASVGAGLGAAYCGSAFAAALWG